MSVFNRIILSSTANGKDGTTVGHVLSGSICTNVRLTVAWEKREGDRNDLALPAHENQMFPRTPRNPICTNTQRNYSICIPYSSGSSWAL